MRGQLPLATGELWALRIIPARAGPTRLLERQQIPPADHPRSCGANHPSCRHALPAVGSSPLVRGQRGYVVNFTRNMRIIPARAGPTVGCIIGHVSCPDHPRSCGANRVSVSPARWRCGSSPLVRGQPAEDLENLDYTRIIPARAGPTPQFGNGAWIETDHPRSCGANKKRAERISVICGSSPLVRGQHVRNVEMAIKVRIIPARAGPTV